MRFTRWAHLGGALVFVGLLLSTDVARATPQDLFSFGTRSPGLGMTGVSYICDWEAVYLNPANLAGARRRRLSFSANAAVYDLHVDHERFPLEAARGTTIGFHLPLPFGDILEDRLVLGAGFYTPTNVLLRGDVSYADLPQFTVLSRAQSIAIQVGLGFDFHHIVDGLRLGVGISALANVIGDLQVRLDESSSFVSVVETQLLTAFSPIVGVTYDHGDWGVGAVYRHEVRAELDLRIVVQDLPVPIPAVSVAGLIQYDPPSVALEGFWMADPNVRIVLNATARFWSAYPGSARPTSRNSYLAPAPRFADTISPRLAVEGTLREGNMTAQVRGGYAFEFTPAPVARMDVERLANGMPHDDDAGNPILRATRLLDQDRHVFTLGFGFDYAFGEREHLLVDLYGQLHASQDRVHAIPGDRDVVANAENPGMVSGGFMYVGGWSLGMEF
jgi:long-chain fatty acid transport protein